MKSTKSDIPKHVRLVLERINAGQIVLKRGTVQYADVYHDPSCNLIRGQGECTCQPELGEIQDISPEGKK